MNNRTLPLTLATLLLALPAWASTLPSPLEQQWPYRFTEAQSRTLEAAGWTPTPMTLLMARRMQARGFTADDYVQAHQDLHSLAIPNPTMVETLAALRYLAIPLTELPRLLASRGSLTRYYNSRIGGRGLKIAGWIMLGVGLANIAVGSIYAAIGDPCSDIGPYEYCSSNYTAVLATNFIVGGALTLVGLPLGIVGTMRVNRWAPDELLDTGSKTDMLPYRLAPGEGPLPEASWQTIEMPRLALSPLLTSHGGGLGLSLRF